VYFLHGGSHFFVDCVANHAHDHHFTSSAWKEMLLVLDRLGLTLGENIKKLVVWSDGGLKTKENLYTFLLIATSRKISVSVNYLGPYHGHSEV